MAVTTMARQMLLVAMLIQTLQGFSMTAAPIFLLYKATSPRRASSQPCTVLRAQIDVNVLDSRKAGAIGSDTVNTGEVSIGEVPFSAHLVNAATGVVRAVGVSRCDFLHVSSHLSCG